MQACNAEPTTDPDVATPSGIDSSYADRAKQYQQQHTRTTRTGSTYEILGFKHFNNKWQDCNTFVVALLKVETWIHGRILECVWWQVHYHCLSRLLVNGSRNALRGSVCPLGLSQVYQPVLHYTVD